MSLLNEAIAAEQLKDQPIIPDPEQISGEDQSEAQPDYSSGFGFDFSFMRTKTGPGSIDEYLNDPLNINGSRGVAQILRGVTGLLGELDLAVIDIGLGLVNCLKEQKANETAVYNPGE